MTIAGARALLDQGSEAVQSILVGAPVEAASALEAAQVEHSALETQLKQAQAQIKRLHRAVARAEEEAKFWRTAAKTAEDTLEAFTQSVTVEVEQLAALYAANA